MPLPVGTFPTISPSQDPPGHVLRRGRAVAAEQFHQHQGLVDMAHGHPLGDVVP
jgi:hypothetical protein